MERSLISLVSQPLNLIHAEILAVTSAMRKNQRWAATSSAPFPSSYSYAGLSDRNGRGGSGSMGLRNIENGRTPRERVDAALMSGFMSLKMELRQVEGNDPATPHAASINLLMHPT